METIKPKIIACTCGGTPTISEPEFKGSFEAICHDCYDGGHRTYDDGPGPQMHTSGNSFEEVVTAWNQMVVEASYEEGGQEAADAVEASLKGCPVWDAHVAAYEAYEAQRAVAVTVVP